MFSLVLSLAVLSIAFGVWSLVTLISQISRARSTALPYVIVPCSCIGAPWLLCQPLLLPLLQCLPTSWTQSWLPLLRFDRGWHDGYEPFSRVGADTFLAVSPGDIVLYTCDADVSTQLLNDQRFGKPAHLMGILNIFGPTIAGTDGPESRLYRRIAAPFFTQQTMRDVFSFSVAGGKELGLTLTKPSAHRQLRMLTAQLSLNILSRICFQNQGQEDLVKALQFQENKPNQHVLGYSEAMHTLFDHYKTIFLSPKWLLRCSPFSTHRLAATAYTELARYVQDLRISKETELCVAESKSPSRKDNLVERFVKAELSAPQINGNIFLFMFAGHEANANTLTFIIILLACHPEIQRAMQADLDHILGDTPPETWSLDAHHRPLMNSLVGAVINEALRLFTLIPVLPKCVPRDSAGIPITVDGESHQLSPGLVALVNTSAIHRHPRYWPRRSNVDFDPYRWLHSDINGKSERSEAPDAGFLVPPPGTFVPFSDGGRGCLGQQFGLAELCAVVAVIFKQSSVRLLTREEESDGREKEPQEKKNSWEAAKERAEVALWDGVEFDMSLRIARDVPLRFDRRDTGTAEKE